MTLRPGKVDVYVCRWIDGYRVEHSHRGLTATEAHHLHVVEKILPGDLVAFIRSASPVEFVHPHERSGSTRDTAEGVPSPVT